jgi:cytochrome c oxidase cbb3-type subunit III
MHLVYRMRLTIESRPTVRVSQRNLVSIKRSIRFSAFPTLWTCGVLAIVLLGVAVLPAQEAEKTSEIKEDTRAVRTREFLGLGRMPDPKMAAEGAKIFGPNCGFCHGADARGGSAPDLLRSPVVLHDNRGEMIGPTVREGRPLRGMPAFSSFTDDQLRDVAEFLHFQVELTANRGTYKILNVVTGDAKAGEAYFKGAGKCNTCHSTTGDLAHIGSKMEPPDLTQAILYPGARSVANGGAKSDPKATVTMRDGKTVTGTVKYQDDFHISLYDADGKYHSIALDQGVKVQVEDKLVFHRQMLDRYTNTQMHDLTAYLVTLK